MTFLRLFQRKKVPNGGIQMIDYIRTLIYGTVPFCEVIETVSDDVAKEKLIVWNKHYLEFMKSCKDSEKSFMKQEILLFEQCRDVNINTKHSSDYNISEELLKYVTNEDLKMLYFKYDKISPMVENKALYLIEREIDRRNPNVYTDMRQFDFEQILSQEPFTKR